jgi:hypothetical protein
VSADKENENFVLPNYRIPPKLRKFLIQCLWDHFLPSLWVWGEFNPEVVSEGEFLHVQHLVDGDSDVLNLPGKTKQNLTEDEKKKGGQSTLKSF